MTLIKIISRTTRRYLRSESGEVTIAWVVITSAIVSLSVLVMSSIGNGAQEFSEKADAELSNRPVTTTY